MICSYGTNKNIKTKYEYSLHMAQQQGYYQKKLHIKHILMKVDFSFIFLLALSAIIDIYVEI
jgi:hypothetical protein